jgi:CBS domain-containing protein
MADNSESKRLNQPLEQSRTTTRAAAQGAADIAEQSATTTEQVGRSVSETMQKASEAGAQTMRHLNEGMTQTARHNTEGLIDAQQEFVQSTAKHFEQAVIQLSQGLQESARDWRTFLQLPNATGSGFQEIQRSINTAFESVIRTNLRVAEEYFRLSSTVHWAELQQRIIREHLGALLESGTSLARAIWQSADQALYPLEQRIVERQQAYSGGHEPSGRVADVMERDVRIASPDDTVQQAARAMRESDTGALPVGESDRLVGMVTDRDVTVRLVAEGGDPARTKVRDVMTPEVRYVFEDEDLEYVADNMAQQQVRRLPVMNRQKRLIGVVSLGNIAKGRRSQLAGRALQGIAREGGQHAQTAAE